MVDEPSRDNEYELNQHCACRVIRECEPTAVQSGVSWRAPQCASLLGHAVTTTAIGIAGTGRLICRSVIFEVSREPVSI
jgi:hypothetical protein